MKVERAPKIVFDGEAYERIMSYAKAADGEVSGFGTVEEMGDHLLISEVYIFPQKANPAGVMIGAEEIHQFMKWCRDNGHPERPAKARLWWHSHANYPCFRSDMDNGTVGLLLQVMPYLVCLVVNKRREYELSLHYPTHAFTKLPIRKEDWKGRVDAECAAEVAEMVHKWEYVPEVEHKAPFMGSEAIPISTDEARYLDSLMLHGDMRNPVTDQPETPWQRWQRERDKGEVQDPEVVRIHEMTDAEFEAYCKRHDAVPLEKKEDSWPCMLCGQHEAEPKSAWCKKCINEDNEEATKRFIVEDGEMRPE